MLKINRRHLAPAHFLARHDAPVTSDDLRSSIHEHRHIEAEGLDAAGNLPDLPLAVGPRILGIEFQVSNRSVDNGYWRWGLRTSANPVFSLSSERMFRLHVHTLGKPPWR